MFALDEVVKTIERYDKLTAERVAYGFREIAYKIVSTKNNKDMFIKIINILKNTNKNIFEIFNEEKVYEILKENLDLLIKDEETLKVIAIYIKSGKEFPKPNEINIKNYKEIANEFLKNRYGINRKLSLDNILLFLEIEDKYLREEIIKYVNGNEEKMKNFTP